ncbi:MAG: response regulator [Hyphomicrobiaceae bacterium]
MPAHRIIIVDDHPLFRGALNQALSTAIPSVKIAEAGSLDELDKKLSADAYDLILLDLAMPGVQGLSGLVHLRAQWPEIPVVVVSASEEARIVGSAIEFGASGYIPKSQPAERIREGVRKVLDGEIWTPPEIELAPRENAAGGLAAKLATLTPQQARVLMMLGEGLLNKQIAFRLGVSEATVKAHVSAILQKLGVDSRTQAVIAVAKLAQGDPQMSDAPAGSGGSTSHSAAARRRTV